MQNILPKIIHKRKNNTKNNYFNIVLTLQKQHRKTHTILLNKAITTTKHHFSHNLQKTPYFTIKQYSKTIINTKTTIHALIHTLIHAQTYHPTCIPARQTDYTDPFNTGTTKIKKNKIEK